MILIFKFYNSNRFSVSVILHWWEVLNHQRWSSPTFLINRGKTDSEKTWSLRDYRFRPKNLLDSEIGSVGRPGTMKFLGVVEKRSTKVRRNGT